MPRQDRADVAGRSLPPIPTADFHRLDDVNLQHLHHFQFEAADAILHGANPGEIPFYQVSKFELSINLKSAKALGLTVPSTLLATADRVVEVGTQVQGLKHWHGRKGCYGPQPDSCTAARSIADRSDDRVVVEELAISGNWTLLSGQSVRG